MCSIKLTMYNCKQCNFNSTFKHNYESHLKTKKHKNQMKGHLKDSSENMENMENMENVENVENQPICENITLTIQEEQDFENKTFAYYYKYLTLYNELDAFRKNNRKAINEGTSIWIQQMRELNIQYKECYKEYDLKRSVWKPIKSMCINQIKSYIREKKYLKWKRRSELRDNYIIIKVNRLVPYLLSDIRNYRSPIQ